LKIPIIITVLFLIAFGKINSCELPFIEIKFLLKSPQIIEIIVLFSECFNEALKYFKSLAK